MDIRTTQRSLRTIEDLMNQQSQRSQQRQEAINQGIEQFVKVQEAKSKLAIRAIVQDRQSLRTHA